MERLRFENSGKKFQDFTPSYTASSIHDLLASQQGLHADMMEYRSEWLQGRRIMSRIFNKGEAPLAAHITFPPVMHSPREDTQNPETLTISDTTGSLDVILTPNMLTKVLMLKYAKALNVEPVSKSLREYSWQSRVIILYTQFPDLELPENRLLAVHNPPKGVGRNPNLNFQPRFNM